jgi:Arc/MetJ-type ribon-helix-helix transcriptional regulator
MLCDGVTMAQQKKEMENLNVRVPSTLKELIEKFVSLDCHTNISDFTRDALRQKLQKDAPQLYKQLFEVATQ